MAGLFLAICMLMAATPWHWGDYNLSESSPVGFVRHLLISPDNSQAPLNMPNQVCYMELPSTIESIDSPIRLPKHFEIQAITYYPRMENVKVLGVWSQRSLATCITCEALYYIDGLTG